MHLTPEQIAEYTKKYPVFLNGKQVGFLVPAGQTGEFTVLLVEVAPEKTKEAMMRPLFAGDNVRIITPGGRYDGTIGTISAIEPDGTIWVDVSGPMEVPMAAAQLEKIKTESG